MNDVCGAGSAEVELRELERQRCDAMRRGDFARLREILHPDLLHVHAKGQVDDYSSYFTGGGTHVEYKQIDRFDLNVRVIGDAAIMSGRQLLVAVRKDGSGTVRIDSRVLQVWTLEGGSWRQIAFQTTPTELSITQ
ncbi:nuclear transport factor 2 family protein [Cupriavidus sp. amp6]|uniref:nuclear transport factor 2 family protein n=1 Tax=Cupriavidus sp. amp6 TaxID=388051 RepID=UPI0004071B58|nr:nuclear transport factor 2 family protein [Cupriavidus sp. amp6]